MRNLCAIKYYYRVKKDGGLREVELAHKRGMRNSSKSVAGNLKLKDRSEDDSLILNLKCPRKVTLLHILDLWVCQEKHLKCKNFKRSFSTQ